MTHIEPNRTTYTHNTLPPTAELVRLVKSLQRKGQVHIPRKPECAKVPRRKRLVEN